MIFSNRFKIFWRLVSIFTLVTFLPSSVQAWHLLPETTTGDREAQRDAGILLDVGRLDNLLGSRDGVEAPDTLVASRDEAGEGKKTVQELDQLARRTDTERPSVRLRKGDADRLFEGLGTPVDLAKLSDSARRRVEDARIQVAAPYVVQRNSVKRTVKGATGPIVDVVSVEDRLVYANQARSQGDFATAIPNYLTVLDESPKSEVALQADIGLQSALNDVRRGAIGSSAVDEMLSALPTWESLTGPFSKHGLVRVLEAHAEHELRTKTGEVARSAYERVFVASGKLIDEYPLHELMIDGVHQHLNAAKALGAETLKQATRSMFAASQSPTYPMLSYGYRAAATYIAQFVFNDSGRAHLMALDLTVDAGKGYIQALLDDPLAYPWLKAEAVYGLAMAHFNIGNEEEALYYFDFILQHYQDAGDITHQAAYCKAFMIHFMNPYDYPASISAYQDFLDMYPEADCLDRGLYSMAEVYFRAEEYGTAIATLDLLLRTFPDSGLAESSRNSIRYIEEHLLFADRSAILSDDTIPLPAPKLANACGPTALRNVFASLGAPVSVRSLAAEAGMDESGTTMQGLLHAAQRYGLALEGISNADALALPTPYIAFVNDDHFICVTQATAHQIQWIDSHGPLRSASVEEFTDMWNGNALVLEGNSPTGQPMTPDALVMARGGQVAIFPDTNRPVCPNGNGEIPDDCPVPPKGHGLPAGNGDDSDDPCNRKGGDGDGAGSVGGAGVSLGGGASADSGVPGGPSGMTGATGSGVTAGEVDFYTLGRQGAQLVKQTDFYAPTRGELALEFTRHFHNRWGTARQELASYPGQPYGKNIGYGWFHNYNLHLVTSTNVDDTGTAPTAGYPPLGVLIVRAETILRFDYDSTTGGIDKYVPDDETLGIDQGNLLFRNNTSGEYWIEYPSGSQEWYSASSGAPDYVSRLTAIKDRSGNAISLSYHGTTNRLQTATAPSGDGRSLNFSYDSNHMITKIELKKGATVLREVTYGYANWPSLQLYSISYPDGYDNKYYYGHDGIDTSIPAYISRFDSKDGTSTYFSKAYATGFGGYSFWRSVNEILVTHPNGLRTLFDRSQINQDLTVINYDGVPETGTPLSKTLLSPGPYGYYNNYIAHFTASNSIRRWDFSYDTSHNLSSVEDPGDKRIHTYSHNSKGQVTSIRRGTSGPQIIFAYDAAGLRPTKRTDPNAAESTYQYDSQNRLTRYYHPSMGTGDVDYAYNSTGELTSLGDPMGQIWSYEYDTMGNLTQVETPLGKITGMEYNDLNQVTKVTDAEGKNTFYEYGSSSCGSCGASVGRITKVKGHDDGVNDFQVKFEYDANGNVTRATDALGRETGYEFDNMHRLTAVVSPHGSTNKTIYAYDLLGRVTSITDLDGNVTDYEYDFLGQLTKIDDAAGFTTLDYYTNGNLSQMTDGNGRTTNFYYWDLGGLAKMVDEEGKEVHYWYDGLGNLTKTGAGSAGTTDQTLFDFDDGSASSTGLIVEASYTNGFITKTVSYAHDNAGRVTKVEDDWLDATNTDGIQYAFDADGRLTKVTDFDDATLDYFYDDVGNVTKVNDYDSADTIFAYDNLHRMTALTAPGSKVWSFEHNKLGQLTKYTHPNAMTSEYLYDTRNRLSQIAHKDGSTVVQGWDYGLSRGGNILSMANLEDDGAWDYTYDGRQRLTDALYRNSAGTPLYRLSYGYEPGDNLTTKTKRVYEPVYFDTFADGDVTANPTWVTSGGAWTASSEYAVNTADTSASTLQQSGLTLDGFVAEMDYYIESGSTTTQVQWGDASNHHMGVSLLSDKILLRKNTASWTTLKENTNAASSPGVWYSLRVVRNGNHVQVYWAERGETLQLVLQSYEALTSTATNIRHYGDANQSCRWDNLRLLTEVTPDGFVHDPFEDGDLLNPTWTQTAGTWTVANGYVANTSNPSAPELTLMGENGDGEYWFSYYLVGAGDRSRLNIRRDPTANDRIAIVFFSGEARIQEEDNTVFTTLDQDSSVTSSIGTWYDVYVRAEGANIDVWRGERGSAMSPVLSTSSAVVLTGDRVTLDAPPNKLVRYDNVSVVGDSSQRSFKDDFSDGDYTASPAWTVIGGTWAVAGVEQYLANTNTSGDALLASETTSNQDVNVRFTYTITDNGGDGSVMQVGWHDPMTEDYVAVALANINSVIASDVDGSGLVFLDSVDPLGASYGVAYDLQIVTDGAHMQVWHGESGSEPTLIMETDSMPALPNGIFFVSASEDDYGVTDQFRLDNFVYEAHDPEVTTYTHNGANELERMVANGRQTLYTYDAWGRTTGTFTGVEEWEYEYRFGNYLKRAERSESGASQERVEYINDGNGKRRLRQVTDTSFGGSGVITAQTWYRWAGLEELGEYEQGGGGFWDIGTKTLSHIPGLGAVAGASQASGDYRYYLQDHLGSTRSIRDGAKAPLARYAYTPYGQPTVNVGLALSVGYTGHAWDDVTQQWFAPYRYYDPSNARWLWRDPLGFVDGPNMYGYVGGSPLNYSDPTGESAYAAIGRVCVGAIKWVVSKVRPPRPTPKPAVKPAPTIKETVPRKKKGRDGGESKHVLEKDKDGNHISKEHIVIKDGKVVHRHKDYVPKHGDPVTGKKHPRRFPDEWDKPDPPGGCNNGS